MVVDDTWQGYLELTLRLVLALVSGAILGWDREQQEKPAGLRTHMLVALGSAIFVLLGLDLSQGIDSSNAQVQVDLAKVLAGIIGGIGFLGAGTIMEKRGDVEGITTAASIWVVAGVGVAWGLGSYFIAIAAVVLSITILSIARFTAYRALVNQSDRSTNKDEDD